MNFHRLFLIQKGLDDRIRQEHGLIGRDLIADKVLALQVELAELANETRCFKYWSKKPPADRDVILEEYVDGLHFVISLGIELGYDYEPTDLQAGFGSLTERFTALLALTAVFGQRREADVYRELFDAIWGLGSGLGFTAAEIEAAYLAKNEVNHRRQEQGY
ncbi:dUTP diphosphatase [Tumebacillus sp. DT12]|uniref:dUTP diphosphatase n=1 Tax=Tumebacillus lacus TaxID=2995335 RepID=A0ABT3X3W6_9BACL|nr:dUTP diphosphatase [Tumebacillus lacus]MCX7570517.1 dUTP diphosphatase [Tumebacillus lacus]